MEMARETASHYGPSVKLEPRRGKCFIKSYECFKFIYLCVPFHTRAELKRFTFLIITIEGIALIDKLKAMTWTSGRSTTINNKVMKQPALRNNCFRFSFFFSRGQDYTPNETVSPPPVTNLCVLCKF